MMPFPFRSQLAKFLRQQGFQPKVSGNIIQVNNYSFVLDESMQYITVYNPFAGRFSYSTPYCTPQNLLNKVRSLFAVAIPPEHAFKAKLVSNSTASPLITSRKTKPGKALQEC